MKCIAIDDEKMALDVITGYIQKTEILELKASFVSSLRGLEYLQTNPVDLLFIDIDMPDLSGIQFLESLEVQPLVIFTTAYSEYAVKSFEYNVIDFLLKPIDFPRFLKAVNRAHKHFLLRSGNISITQEAPATPIQGPEKKHLLIKSGTKLIKLAIDDILYAESYGNYMIFYTHNERLVSVYTMKELTDLLPANEFARCHKSYLVSLSHIDCIEKHQVTIGSKKIPVGKIYKESFFSKIK